jgi:hypothetical protein
MATESRRCKLGLVVLVVEDALLAELLGKDFGDLGNESAPFAGKGEGDSETLFTYAGHDPIF